MRKLVKKIFQRKYVVKFLFFYLSSKLILLLIFPLISSNFFQIFNLENAGNPDLVFNDLHFKARSTTCHKDKDYLREKSVVLINTGSLKEDSFRLHLSYVLNKLKTTEVRAIGLDHHFVDNFETGLEELKKSINENPKIVMSLTKGIYPDSAFIKVNAIKGYTGLPDPYTQRRYLTSEETFGYQLSKMAFPEKTKKIPDYNNSFNINYVSTDSGQIPCLDTFDKHYAVNFKFIEADKFLRDSANFSFFEKLIKDKIVIIGHLGTSFYDRKFDIQDKFAVPIDKDRIMMREKTMYGPVIHANAIENILHPEMRFFEFSDFTQQIIQELLFMLFMIYLFIKLSKFVNILTLVLISIPYIFVTIHLMDFNIYISVSSTLLELLFIEEFLDILEPFYNKLSSKYKFFGNISTNESNE